MAMVKVGDVQAGSFCSYLRYRFLLYSLAVSEPSRQSFLSSHRPDARRNFLLPWGITSLSEATVEVVWMSD